MAPTAKVRADLNLSGGSHIGMRCQLRFNMAFRTKARRQRCENAGVKGILAKLPRGRSSAACGGRRRAAMVRYTPMMRAPVLETSSSSRAAFALGSAACVGALTFGAARYMRSSRLMCSDAASSERAGEDILLADISVGASHVLLTSPSSVAFSGLQPIVPGHCIVAPLRPVGRAPELSDAEWLDLWRTARRAQAAVEARHGAGASNLLLKDGTARLPHLHAHVVPRLQGDFAVSDMVFGLMDGWAPTAAATGRLPAHVKLPLLADDERKDRTSG